MEINKKNILVLWAKWMLWNAIFSFLKKENKLIVFWTSNWIQEWFINFSVDNKLNEKIENIFNEYNFDYVINCIWYIRPKSNSSIDEYNKSLFINSYFPKILDFYSNKFNFKLIHFSTDCVFDWKKWNYSIDDFPNEFSIYWLSKFLWEISNSNSLTIRTSIIWIELTKVNKNLLNWFLSNQDWTKISWFSNVYWNWVTTITLAKIILKIINEKININGLVQIASEKISKYELLLLFNNIFTRNIIIENKSNIKSNKTIVPSVEQKYFINEIKTLDKQIIELKEFYKL